MQIACGNGILACMSRDFGIFMPKHLAGQWLATRTSRLAADCDSGWRIMAEDQDEKCFDRLEQLELVSLAEVCQLEPAFAEIMEQAEEQAFYLVNGQFQLGELPEYWD